MVSNVEHQVLDTLREADHQLAWWEGTTMTDWILWDGICTLLAFGFLAEGLHVLQVISKSPEGRTTMCIT